MCVPLAGYSLHDASSGSVCCRWLAAKGHTERAHAALQGLRTSHREAERELHELAEAVAADSSPSARHRPLDVLRSPVLRYQLHVGMCCRGRLAATASPAPKNDNSPS